MTIQEWNWCMDWCHTKRLSPTKINNFNQAKLAYAKHKQNELRELKCQ